MIILEPFAISLGANLGNTEESLKEAVRKISALPGVQRIRLSPLYRTQAVDTVGKDEFHNAVISGQTRLTAAQLLEALKKIEAEAGRDPGRPDGGPPYADRELDLDLLFYGRDRLDSPQLTVPHPRLESRRFYLAPLARACPFWVHPGSGRTVEQLLDALPPEPWARVEKEKWL